MRYPLQAWEYLAWRAVFLARRERLRVNAVGPLA
jgi:hypothetical protein